MKPELLKQAIIEFKEIYLSEFGIYLTDSEATEKVLSIMQLFDVLTKTS